MTRKFDTKNHVKLRHHCQVTSKFLFACCGRCNLLLKYKQTKRLSKNTHPSFEVPVLFHNSTGFDSHIILQHVGKISKRDSSSCIGTSSEKLLTSTYHGFKLLDSCHFLQASLAMLANILKDAGVDKFVHSRRIFDDDIFLMMNSLNL